MNTTYTFTFEFDIAAKKLEIAELVISVELKTKLLEIIDFFVKKQYEKCMDKMVELSKTNEAELQLIPVFIADAMLAMFVEKSLKKIEVAIAPVVAKNS